MTWRCNRCETYNTEDSNICDICNEDGIPPILKSFKASPENIEIGKSNIIKWNINNADEISLLGEGTIPNTGKKEVFLTDEKEFTIEASNEITTRKFKLKILLPPPEIISFTKNVDFIEEGKDVFLSWNIVNAEKVTINPDVGDVTGKDSIQIHPKKTTIYEIVASNKSNSVEDSLTIELLPLVLEGFKLSKDVVITGRDFKLNWSAENYKQLLLNETHDVTGKNEISLNAPEHNADYTLTAKGHFGVEKKLIQNLKVPELIFSIKKEDGKSLIIWDSKNIENLEINNEIGKVATTGSIEVPEFHKETVFEIEGITKYGDKLIKTITLKPVIIHDFNIDNHFVYDGRKVLLDWNIENEEKVIIEGYGNFTGKKSAEIVVKKTTPRIKLIAFGRGDNKERVIELKFIEIPKFNLKDIGTPKIDLNLSYSISKNEFLKTSKTNWKQLLGKTPKFTSTLPKIQKGTPKLKNIQVMDSNVRESFSKLKKEITKKTFHEKKSF